MSNNVLRGFVLSSSCSDISANELFFNRLGSHSLSKMAWLPNRSDISDGAFVDPELLRSWLDKILPDVAMTMQLMQAQADNIFIYRLMEMDADIARARSDEQFMKGLVASMTLDLLDNDRYRTRDEFELQYQRGRATEIRAVAAFLQEFCWWLHQQLERKAHFYWVEFDFSSPHRGQPWLGEADLAWSLKIPKLQREKAALDE